MPQPAPARPAKILIAEDSPTQAKLLEQVLVAQGHRVFIANNGKKALEHLLADRPDLVISDILMPEMDGFELCRQIRGTESLERLPVILLTNMNDPADVLHSLEAGANYFISKPFNTKQLLSRIATILRGENCPVEGADGGITLNFHGRDFAIKAPRGQIIDLLLSTYEIATEKNQELLRAKQELLELNQDLERRVTERTAELVRETAERVQAVEDLRKKDEVLMQQSRQAALGEMIGNIAHQWRQPLNATGLMVQEIKLRYELGGFSKEYLETSTTRIMNLVHHMSQTIDDFRNFFTPNKDKVSFDLRETVTKTLSLVEGALAESRIRVQTSLQEVPEVVGYPNELAQVLLNILNNARDAFTTLVRDAPLISITVTTQQGKAVVTIADNAGGIPDEIIGRIFEPYFTTKEQGKGTGIGLYMSKNIIEKTMNGSLTVRNTGQGAEFRIEV